MPIKQLKTKPKKQTWRQGHPTRSTKKKFTHYPKTTKSKRMTKTRTKVSDFWLKQLLMSKKLWKAIGILVVLFFLAGLIAFAWFSRGLPNPNQLITREIPQSTKIYDRTGENILYEIHGEEKRTLVSLENIPDYIEQATISIEDKHFYEHGGFSVWAIIRTTITNVLYNQRAGGSTLTQQFVKNSILTSEKRYSRKIKEIILASRLEQKFSKNEILQMYLNEIPYGSNAYGIEAASRKYFSKGVEEINLAEAAVLAALPQAPSRYSPYGPNRKLLLGRQGYILEIMEKQGYITKEERDQALEYEIEFSKPADNITAPHFVMYVKGILSERYGEKTIEQGGLKIYTTLDLYKQDIAEEVIKERAESNEESWQASNAALVSIDPKNGQVLAMVGSKDYFNDEIDGQFNVAISPRQPGSSLKPLVYAALFEKGYKPETILFDTITNFSTNDSEPYEPHNYNDNELGPVSIKKALAGSLNIPAVKAIYLAGIDNVLNLAENTGYSTLADRNRFGLSLVLGGAEVKLLEHVNSYSVFAREGKVHPIAVILKVEDSKGIVLEEFKEKEKTVLNGNIARMINSILSDNEARAYAFGENNWLTLSDRPVAAKTGTTNDYRDAWTIGYTPSLITGVWVGNNDNSEMKRGAAGGVVAAPIWNAYMQRVLGDTPIETFNTPEIKETGKDMLDGIITFGEKIKIDRASGFLATEHTPKTFIEEVEVTNFHSILHFVNKNHPLGEIPSDPSKDSQYELWEKGIQEWLVREQEKEVEEGEEDTSIKIIEAPTEYDNLHISDNLPTLTIVEPKNNKVVTGPLQSSIKTSAPRGINRLEYYVDGTLLFANYGYPFNLHYDVSFLDNGYHKLTVRSCDDIDNCTSETLNFNLNLNSNPVNNINLKINLTFPANGLALNSFDFPLTAQVSNNAPSQVSKLEIILQKTDTETSYVKGVINNPSTKISEIIISESPEPGQYNLWIKAYKWKGGSVESQKSLIIVN